MAGRAFGLAYRTPHPRSARTRRRSVREAIRTRRVGAVALRPVQSLENPFVCLNASPSTIPAATATFSDLKPGRSEEHTSELQSLMRISYAVFCLKNNIPWPFPHHRDPERNNSLKTIQNTHATPTPTQQ